MDKKLIDITYFLSFCIEIYMKTSILIKTIPKAKDREYKNMALGTRSLIPGIRRRIKI